MVVEPYLAGLVPDIMLIPVSISYERTLEESLFSKELLGVPKPPESTRVSVCTVLIAYTLNWVIRCDNGISINQNPYLSIHGTIIMGRYMHEVGQLAKTHYKCVAQYY